MKPQSKLLISPESILIHDNGHVSSINWSAITSVQVFKRDRFVVDMICMCIEADHGIYEINEEFIGWDDLCSELPTRLSGCKKFHEWFETVAFPAFKQNWVKIFER